MGDKSEKTLLNWRLPKPFDTSVDAAFTYDNDNIILTKDKLWIMFNKKRNMLLIFIIFSEF